MHEYGLMQNVLGNVRDQLKETPLSADEKPVEIKMTIGALEIHSEESFVSAFEILLKEIPELEGVTLDLDITLGRIDCACGYADRVSADEGDPHDATPVTTCPKCGVIVNILDGRGVSHIELVTEKVL